MKYSYPTGTHYYTVMDSGLVDVNKLAKYMRSNNLDTSHWDDASAGKIDPWAIMRSNDPNGQTKQFNLPK